MEQPSNLKGTGTSAKGEHAETTSGAPDDDRRGFALIAKNETYGRIVRWTSTYCSVFVVPREYVCVTNVVTCDRIATAVVRAMKLSRVWGEFGHGGTTRSSLSPLKGCEGGCEGW